MDGPATAAAAGTQGSRANASRIDPLSAAAAAIVAGGVYIRTLAPGLVADLDTPMFQFIGRVLGVAHNPGYPLFVFLTFPFSYLPVGNLAYRINLFSALFASLTVCFTFLSARRLGCRTVVAFGMALGLAFGKVFWSQAVIAEVYTLNAAIVSGLLLALLEWRRTGQSGWFWCAVLLFSAGIGNHITILGFVPATAVFVLLTDAGFLRQPRTVLISGASVATGLLQYAFILVRSQDPTAYVESRATTLWTLFDVVRARQFSGNLFAFDLNTVLLERVPLLVGSVLQPELGAAGLLLALIGTAWLLLRRDAAGWFVLIGFAAIFAFTLNYEVVDSPVFLIPAILMSWLAAAVGAELIINRLDARNRIIGAAVAAAMLALPAAGLRANFAANDMSRTTDADVQFERLFEKLPAKAALVREDFVVDRMLMYHLVGVGSARGRQIELVPADGPELNRRLGAGFGVFGFEKGIRRLRPEGLSFSDRPERLIRGPLSDFLADLPIGSLVAIAVPRRHRSALDRSGASVAAIGGHDERSVLDGAHRIVIGVAGTQGAIERHSHDDLSVSLSAGEPIGTTERTAPADIEVETRGERAAIRLRSRDIVATREGAAVAVWDPAGRLSRTLVLEPTDRFHVPVATSQLSVYRLRGHWTKQNVAGDAWADLADIAGTGHMMAHIPRGAELLLYLQDDEPLAPRTSEWSSNALKVDFTSFNGVTDDALRVLRADQGDPGRFVPSTPLHRVRMIAPNDGPDRISVELALGGVPTRAIGRLSGDSRRPAALFRVDTSDLLREIDAQTNALLMGRDAQQQLIGYGWAPVETDAAGPYRWMTATSARVLLPIDRNGDPGLLLHALGGENEPTSLAITLNSVTLPSQALRQGWAWYEWTPPAGTLRPGTNELTITVDRLSPPRRDLEPRGPAVAELRVSFGRRSE